MENIIIHGEVAFDATRFHISLVLYKEKSVCIETLVLFVR